ncbi:hypothetical protein MIDIC_110037 [Alphaproteobacteria bacterium]
MSYTPNLLKLFFEHYTLPLYAKKSAIDVSNNFRNYCNSFLFFWTTSPNFT